MTRNGIEDIQEIVKVIEVHRTIKMVKVVNGNENVTEAANGEKMVEKIDMMNASDTTGIKLITQTDWTE